LHALARHQQPRRLRITIRQELAQLMERLPQAVARTLFAIARPEKLGQFTTPMDPSFNGQIGQQGAHLFCLKCGHGRAGQGHLKIAKTNDLQRSHRKVRFERNVHKLMKSDYITTFITLNLHYLTINTILYNGSGPFL